MTDKHNPGAGAQGHKNGFGREIRKLDCGRRTKPQTCRQSWFRRSHALRDASMSLTDFRKAELQKMRQRNHGGRGQHRDGIFRREVLQFRRAERCTKTSAVPHAKPYGRIRCGQIWVVNHQRCKQQAQGYLPRGKRPASHFCRQPGHKRFDAAIKTIVGPPILVKQLSLRPQCLPRHCATAR